MAKREFLGVSKGNISFVFAMILSTRQIGFERSRDCLF